jgi:hypothetical protein
VLPGAVAEEIRAGPADDPACRFLTETPDWLSIVEPAPGLSPLALWRLGPGESEVLEYARRLLVAAAEMGLLPSLSEAVEAAEHNFPEL